MKMYHKTVLLLLGVTAFVVLWHNTYANHTPLGSAYQYCMEATQGDSEAMARCMAATPPQIAEGASVECNDGTGMVYRFTGNQLRHYPSPAIAASWNPQWATGIVNLTAQQCQAIPKGEPMPLLPSPLPQIAEGASVACNDGTGMVYRFTKGQLRHYPSPAIAASWDPQWGTGIVSLTAQQCQAIPKGDPMPMRVVPPPAPSPSPAPNATKLTSGRTNMGCHTAIGEDRVSCSTIRPRNSRSDITPPAEDFLIEHLDPAQGTFAIKSAVTGKYCSDDNGRLQCTRDQVGAWETFTALRNDNDPNKVAIKGYRLNQADGRFCADDRTNINCNRTTAGAWETFTASNVQAFVPPLPPAPDNADDEFDYSSTTTTMYSSDPTAADERAADTTAASTVVPVVLGVTAAAGASYALYLYALK